MGIHLVYFCISSYHADCITNQCDTLLHAFTTILSMAISSQLNILKSS